MVQRQRRHPFLALFDGADPNSSTPVREATTVPTQALYFLNDQFFHHQAERMAALTKGMPETKKVQQMIERLFQRQPSPQELRLAQELLSRYPDSGQQKWSAFARVLLASNEFMYVD